MGLAPHPRVKRVSQVVMVDRGHRVHLACLGRRETMATEEEMERRVKKDMLDPRETKEQWE